MSQLLGLVINAVNTAQCSFYRYITANDVGKTGGHQAGFYIPKEAFLVAFDKAGTKGENMDKIVSIVWQNDTALRTESRFIYYGRNTRNEYRLTRFGRNFPFLQDKYLGSLLIVCRYSGEDYRGFVLETSEEIEGFFTELGLPPTGSTSLIDNTHERRWEHQEYIEFVLSRHKDFPSTKEMAFWAQKLALLHNNLNREKTAKDPDTAIIQWIDNEYQLFKAFEEKFYRPIYTQPFGTSDELITFANQILNRRKSRAGKSLELHLERIFKCANLSYDSQLTTEGNKKPDFILPGNNTYHNVNYPEDKLIVLAAKTTCKDRWRQILNEADRVKKTYLFTLQKGISTGQLREMQMENVLLVVPQSNINTFPQEYRDKILSLGSFITRARSIVD